MNLPTPLATLLTRFGATDPTLITETPRAHLWRVQVAGSDAVLKHLTDVGLRAGEVNAAAILTLWGGEGAVKLLDHSEDALLLEYLDGSSLGDMARGKHANGDDLSAAHVLATLGAQISGPPDPRFPDIATYGAALGTLDIDAAPAPYRAILACAKTLWHHLLHSSPAPRLLHGDLHHDNIMGSARGWLAIDPKGVNGDPAYEYANAFRNPLDLGPRLCDPARMRAMAEIIAGLTGHAPSRLLDWAFANAALSTCWSLPHGDMTEDNFEVLSCLGSVTTQS